MFDNVSKCAVSGGGSTLVKAKSSPNVSKASLSSAKKQNQSNRTNPTIAPVKSSRSGKSPTTSRISIKVTNDTINSPHRGSINSDSSKSGLASPSKPAKRFPSETRPDTAKTVSSPARSNDKKKVCKSVSSSPSCTILEDRALLKKGLTYTPDKMPAKPEVLQRKGTLDRSVSLNSVSADNQTSPTTFPRWIPIPLERKSVEKGKKTELSRKNLTFMNRSASLWSVQMPKVDYNQCKKSYGAPARLNSISRPSKIPLPAARSTGLGRSLADLSQVDRVGEPVGQMISFELDLDATSDERIYENCRETLDRASKLSTSRISTSTSNLEERAARLMAQLEDDLEPKETVVSVDVVDVALPRRTEIVYEDRETLHDSKTNIIAEKCNSGDDKSKESPRVDEESKRRKMVDIFKDNNTKPEEDLKKKEYVVKECTSNRIKSCEKSEEVAEKSRRSKETSIQELRRNWERHSRGNQDCDAKTIYVANSGKTVNLSKMDRTGNDVVDDVQETKRKQCVGKRTNDIEHLVNFFNCKNAVSKESPREVPIKPKPADVPIIETPALKKNESKGANEYSGYTSDGNSSEDSGHISNENEVEWKETIENQSQRETDDFKKQQYFGRIDQDDDVKLFDSTIVRRLIEPEKKNIVVDRGGRLTSCDDSTIDCCQIDDKCSENERQVRLK